MGRGDGQEWQSMYFGFVILFWCCGVVSCSPKIPEYCWPAAMSSIFKITAGRKKLVNEDEADMVKKPLLRAHCSSVQVTKTKSELFVSCMPRPSWTYTASHAAKALQLHPCCLRRPKPDVSQYYFLDKSDSSHLFPARPSREHYQEGLGRPVEWQGRPMCPFRDCTSNPSQCLLNKSFKMHENVL